MHIDSTHWEGSMRQYNGRDTRVGFPMREVAQLLGNRRLVILNSHVMGHVRTDEAKKQN